MSDPFDLDRLRDVPDPFAALGPAPPPVRPAVTSPARSQVRTTRALALAGAVAYEAAWIAHLHMHAANRPPWMIGLEIALPLAIGAAAWVEATRAGRRGLGASVAHLAVLAVGLPLAFAAVTLTVYPLEQSDGGFWARAIACIVSGAFFTAAPLALGLISLRRAFASASPWRTATLGLTCGALAVATLAVVCPLATAGHLIVGHGTAFVTAAVIASLVGRRIALA